MVISKLSHTENYHIVKGYFPESAAGLEDVNFAFASIDVDLYRPTYEGGYDFFMKDFLKVGIFLFMIIIFLHIVE